MYSADKIWLSIDSLVFGYDTSAERLKLLLFRRELEPYKGDWSLIGGFVDEQEDLHSAATRVLKKFTGLDDVFLEQLRTFGDANRDPGGRVVSTLYWSLIKLDDLHKEIAESYGARWFDIDNIPEIVLDHGMMVKVGLQEMKNQARSYPIGFELLPSEFTLPQLLRLYEAIYQTSLDDRNFRKKMLATNLLIKLDKKDMKSSKKGAFLYAFNKEKYDELAEKGFYIDFMINTFQPID